MPISISKAQVWGLLAAWAACLACVGLGGLAVVFTGAFDTAADTPHPPLVAWATHRTMIDSVKLRSRHVVAPTRFSDAQVREGYALYDRECVSCHGAPGVDRSAWAAGVNPTPPYLLDASQKWTPAQLYWILHSGVKMSAMPAWDSVNSDPQIWSLVAFLENLPHTPPSRYAEMRATAAVGATTPVAVVSSAAEKR